MLVKNIGKKIIGMGDVVFMPDDIKKLPKGFAKNHPVVDFYFYKNWLTVVTGDDTDVADTENIEDTEDDTNNDSETINDSDTIETADAKIKSLSNMNLEQLREEAFILGVEINEKDTKANITKKITERLQTETE